MIIPRPKSPASLITANTSTTMLLTRSRIPHTVIRAYYCTEKRLEPLLQPALHSPPKTDVPPPLVQPPVDSQKTRVETLQQNLKNGPTLDEFIVMAKGTYTSLPLRTSPSVFPYTSSLPNITYLLLISESPHGDIQYPLILMRLLLSSPDTKINS